MKGLFIPDITTEMFRNGCLESIEALMAEGEIYDIEYSPWTPVGERLPEKNKEVLTCNSSGYIEIQSIEGTYGYWENQNGDWSDIDDVIAWWELPEPYKAESGDKR